MTDIFIEINNDNEKEHIKEICDKQGYSVGIVGAGFGGIIAAKKCIELGIPFTIYEVADDIGGTWLWNQYPGCGCDVMSHAYSFSWALNPSWSRKWSKREEILDYIQKVAKKGLKLEKNIKFKTKVLSAKWLEDTKIWELELSNQDDKTWIEQHTFIILATGQLNIPKIPSSLDATKFKGKSVHTARWDRNIDLDNKKVICIGTGASAIQLLPEIVTKVKELIVVQSSPAWIGRKNDKLYPEWVKKCFKKCRALMRLYRFFIFFFLECIWFLIIPNSAKKPSITNKAVTFIGRRIMKDSNFKMHELLIPKYTLGCKRTLLSNDWLQMFSRKNVKLITESASEITSTGVKTKKSGNHDADVIIYATGFETKDFIPISVFGKDGVEIHEKWGDFPQAYMSVAVAQFPNMSIIYGPNSNLNHSSIVCMQESAINLIGMLLKKTILLEKKYFEVNEDAYDKFSLLEQKYLSKTAFSADCNSWYKNDRHSRVINNWHGSAFSFWLNTRKVRWEDFKVS